MNQYPFVFKSWCQKGLFAYKNRPHVLLYISIKETFLIISEICDFFVIATDHNITVLLEKLDLHLLAIEFYGQ